MGPIGGGGQKKSNKIFGLSAQPNFLKSEGFVALKSLQKFGLLTF
jgi:hypothetical protein